MPHLDHIPPLYDDRWEKWSTPVIGFLVKPRTWRDLSAWSRQHRVKLDRVRQCLAWLEHHHKAKMIVSMKGDICWVNSKWKSRESKLFPESFNVPSAETALLSNEDE